MTLQRLPFVAALCALAFGIAGCPLGTPDLPEPVSDAFILRGVHVVEPMLSRRASVDLAIASGAISEATDALMPFDEFAGMTVLPGLIDMHAHLPPDTPLALTEYIGLMNIAHGVTTLREAGDLDGTAVPAAQRARDAGSPMPRVRACGPFVGGSDVKWENWITLARPEDAPAVAQKLHEEGRACVKVYDGLDRPRIEAMVTAAAKHGIVAMGHIPSTLTFEQAQVPDTQHLMGVAPLLDEGMPVIRRIVDWRAVTDARLDEVVKASVDLGIAHTPTLILTKQLFAYEDFEKASANPKYRYIPGMYRKVVWDPVIGLPIFRDIDEGHFDMMRDAWTKRLRLVGMLHRAGVKLRLGSDTQQPFVIPGMAIQQELGHFVEAGIPIEEAWAHGTWRSADGVGIENLGRLTQGAPADLLIFREDPTKSLEAFSTLEAVVSRGKLYRQRDLFESLEAWRAFYENSIIDFVAQTVAKQKMKASVKSD